MEVLLAPVAKCSGRWEGQGNGDSAQAEFNGEGGWAREPSGAGVSLEASGGVGTFGRHRQSSDSSWGGVKSRTRRGGSTVSVRWPCCW